MSAIPDRIRGLVTLRDRYLCQRCGTRGTDLHHRRSRSVPGPHCHCTCNLVLLCRTCHSWAHTNPFHARAQGIIVSRYADDVAGYVTQTKLGALRFDCEGGFTYAN